MSSHKNIYVCACMRAITITMRYSTFIMNSKVDMSACVITSWNIGVCMLAKRLPSTTIMPRQTIALDWAELSCHRLEVLNTSTLVKFFDEFNCAINDPKFPFALDFLIFMMSTNYVERFGTFFYKFIAISTTGGKFAVILVSGLMCSLLFWFVSISVLMFAATLILVYCYTDYNIWYGYLKCYWLKITTFARPKLISYEPFLGFYRISR